MEIISHFNAVTLIDAPWDEVRPLAGGAFPAVFQAVKERYHFQAAGQSPTSQQIGMITPSFQSGQFKFGDHISPINQLEFQPGGILIGSATTEQTEAFFEDVFQFLGTTLGYRKPSPERPRHFATTIIVDFGLEVASLFGKWNRIQGALNALVGSGPEFAVHGVRLGALTSDGQLVGDRQYVFERRAITPLGSNWFFSQAPLDTDRHMKLLSTIDDELRA
jgi:hypothetical protein